VPSPLDAICVVLRSGIQLCRMFSVISPIVSDMLSKQLWRESPLLSVIFQSLLVGGSLSWSWPAIRFCGCDGFSGTVDVSGLIVWSSMPRVQFVQYACCGIIWFVRDLLNVCRWNARYCIKCVETGHSVLYRVCRDETLGTVSSV
jgi:hypothetical protein